MIQHNLTVYSTEAIKGIEAELAALKDSVNYLIALSTKTTSGASISEALARKRAYAEAFEDTIPQHPSPPVSQISCTIAESDCRPTPPFSACEARTLIQEELGRIPQSSTSKQAALHSALLSLKQNLNTSIIDYDSPNVFTSGHQLEKLEIPPVTLMQWMLQCRSPLGDFIFSDSPYS